MWKEIRRVLINIELIDSFYIYIPGIHEGDYGYMP